MDSTRQQLIEKIGRLYDDPQLCAASLPQDVAEYWQNLSAYPDLTSAELATVLKGLGGFFNDYFWPEIAKKIAWLKELKIQPFVQKAEAAMGEFSPSDLTGTLSALVKLDVLPPQSLAAWQRQMISCIDRFEADDLSKSLAVFAKLCVLPSVEFLLCWQSRAVKTMNQFTPLNLSRSIWAFGVFGIEPGALFLSQWQRRAIGTLEEFGTRDLANTLWALRIIALASNGKESPLEMPLRRELQNMPELKLVDEFTLATSALAMGKEVDPHIMKRALIYAGRAPYPTSYMERHLGDILKPFFPSMKHGVKVLSGLSEADFLLQQDGRAMLLEADGPGHFVACDTNYAAIKYNGRTVMMSACIAREMPVLRMPYPVLNRVTEKNGEQFAAVCRAVMGQAQTRAEKIAILEWRNGSWNHSWHTPASLGRHTLTVEHFNRLSRDRLPVPHERVGR